MTQKFKVGDLIYWGQNSHSISNEYLIVEMNANGFGKLRSTLIEHTYDGFHDLREYKVFKEANPYTDGDWI